MIDVEYEVEDPPVVLLEGDLGWLLSIGVVVVGGVVDRTSGEEIGGVG